MTGERSKRVRPDQGLDQGLQQERIGRWRLALIPALAGLILLVLRAAAKALRQVEPRAVRSSVLSRVRSAKPDPGVRQSLEDMEKSPRSQDTSGSMWPVRSRDLPADRKARAGGSVVPPDSEHDRPDSGPDHDVLDRGRGIHRGLTSAIFQPPRMAPAAQQASQPSADAGRKSDAQDSRPNTAAPNAAAVLRFAPPKLPDWFLNGPSATSGKPAQETAAETTTSEPAEPPRDGVSRLSALRGAVSSLRLKTLGGGKSTLSPTRDRAPDAIDAVLAAGIPVDVPPRFTEEVVVRPARTSTSIPAVPEKPIKADPPIIRPREFIPVKKRAAGDEWDEDEVRILPAKPGQYKP